MCLILATYGLGLGQTRQAYLVAAENAFADHNFYASLNYYQEVLEFRDDIAVLYKAAESARLFNAYSLAEEYYQRVVDLEQNNEYPLAMYYLGQVQKQRGKYEDAKENFMIFQAESVLDNPYYAESAVRQMEDCDWAIDQQANPEIYATVERLHDSINSPYSEVAPIKYGDSLYFSSLRFEMEKDAAQPKKLWTKLLSSAVDDHAATVLNNGINSEDVEHTAHFVMNRQGSRVYYTLCEYINGTDIRCDLYYRSLNNAGVLGDPVKLPSNINDSTHTSTQPSLGLDPYGGQEVLYFSSDRRGGKGKSDIWFSVIGDNGEFGDPVNLMAANTVDDEITPYYHEATNTLYFSSDGYQGFGGYDIYSLHLYNIDEPYIENLGAPLNSSYNDIYFALQDHGDTAYFSSNRMGSLYLVDDSEACCNDIYQAAIIEQDLNLQVLTYDQSDNSDLLSATVTLIEVNGDKEIVGQQTLDNTNEFLFDLSKNRSYLIVAERDGYLSDTAMVSTKGLRGSHDLVRRMYLEPTALDLELLVFDEANRLPLLGATVRIRDLADPDREIVVQLNEDGHEFLFPIERNRSYEITVSRRGYQPETLSIDTGNVPGTRLTKRVYLKDGTLEDYMPLAMYFDNDQPNPRSYIRNSRNRYDETFPPYMGRKEVFKDKFADPLIGNARVQAQDDIDRFFEYHVQEGRNDLMRFISTLARQLEAGQKIEIVIQGFASPVATNSYNKVLSERRISTVINELRSGDARLGSYLRSGQLKVITEGKGELTAPEYISDEIEDQRNSIYSVPASRERRVEIIEVRRSN